MAFTKITHAGIGSTGTVLLENLEVTGVGTFGGSVSVGGTLTYEDVTNVDSVGLITARNGIVVGSGITLSKDGDIFATGVTTTGSLVSNGAISGTTGTFTGDVSIADKIVHTGDTHTAIRFAGNDIITAEIAGSETLRIDGTGLKIVDKLLHSGDVDTAIRFPEADTFSVETSGTQRLRVEAAGNINFANNVNVSGATTCSGGVIFLNSISLNASSNNYLYFDDNLHFARNGHGTELIIDSSGNIGVNATSPAALMHVSGSYAAPTGGFGGSVYSVISNSGSANNSCGLSINAGNNGVSFIQLGDYDDANVGTIEYNHSDNSMVFDTAAGERARINSSGHFGIGSGSNTNKPLHIYTGSSDAEIRLQTNSGTEQNSYMSLRQSNGDLDFYTVQSGTSMKFHTANTERVKINGDGIVTKPYTPSFFVTINGGDATTNTNNKIPWNVVKHNTGSHYDTSNYYFVAPVSGHYYFFTQLWAKNGTSNARFHFHVEDASNSYAGDNITQNGFHSNGLNLSDHTMSASVVWYLDVGDRISVRPDNTNLTYYTAGASDPHSYFCGYLIG